MVTEPAGGADDDVAAGGEKAGFAANVHAADAGDDARAGVEPCEFGLHLQRQFAGRGDAQGDGCAVGRHPACPGYRALWWYRAFRHQGECGGQAERDGFAGPGAGGHQQVAAFGLRLKNGGLHGGGFKIAAGNQRRVEHRVDEWECHGRGLGRLRW